MHIDLGHAKAPNGAQLIIAVWNRQTSLLHGADADGIVDGFALRCTAQCIVDSIQSMPFVSEMLTWRCPGNPGRSPGEVIANLMTAVDAPPGAVDY